MKGKYLKDLYRMEGLIVALGPLGAIIGGIATVFTNLKVKDKRRRGKSQW